MPNVLLSSVTQWPTKTNFMIRTWADSRRNPWLVVGRSIHLVGAPIIGNIPLYQPKALAHAFAASLIPNCFGILWDDSRQNYQLEDAAMRAPLSKTVSTKCAAHSLLETRRQRAVALPLAKRRVDLLRMAFNPRRGPRRRHGARAPPRQLPAPKAMQNDARKTLGPTCPLLTPCCGNRRQCGARN